MISTGVRFKDVAEKPADKGTRTKCLIILQDAEVDIGLYTKLHEPNRQVMIKPDKLKLLREIYRARGDEQIEWDDDDPLLEPSSDNDDAEVRNPSFRRKRLPKTRDVMVVVLGELMG